MASLSDVNFFPRKPRLGSTPKARPVMKLEWNKLLAEATEKDFELEKELKDNDAYYDDELYEGDGEGGGEEKLNGSENSGERPLNLCQKSHTVPSLANQIQNGILDLSSGKNVAESKINSTPSGDSVRQNSCTVPNFLFNQVPSSNVAHGKTERDKQKIVESNIENKENYLNHNNVKNVFFTPCNNKSNHQEKIERHTDVDKNKNNHKNEVHFSSKQNVQNLLFLSEKKPPLPSKVTIEKDKILTEEINKKKLDLATEKEKNMASQQRKNGSLKVSNSSHSKPSQISQSVPAEKFAVPAVPAKPKDSSKVLVINKKSYQVLAPLGKGGSSKVYLVLNSDNELLAVKYVNLSDVCESTKNDYLNEIQHLLKMQHSKHVIKLYDHQYVSSQKLLFAVMEKGDTDLSKFLKDKASSDEGISPELIMYYWTEMLLAVKSIHDNNIIHRDLKPANFLLVSGRVKLIDFGIASSIQTEQTSILMESQSGTFNYMSPEALQDLGFENKMVLKIGRKTDVWSLGCILYYFLYKKTPYQDLVKPLQKMKAITDPNYAVPFPKISGVPDILIESCKRCLVHDTKKRASIEELLAFRNRPLFSLSQVLTRLKTSLSEEEYERAAKAFEDLDGNGL